MPTQKQSCSPNVVTPQIFALFMDVYNVPKKEAMYLFKQAINAIDNGEILSAREVKNGYALLRTLEPKDDAEKVLVLTYAVCNMLGMHHVKKSSHKDKELGIKLLKKADEAMNNIQNKRQRALSADD